MLSQSTLKEIDDKMILNFVQQKLLFAALFVLDCVKVVQMVFGNSLNYKGFQFCDAALVANDALDRNPR